MFVMNAFMLLLAAVATAAVYATIAGTAAPQHAAVHCSQRHDVTPASASLPATCLSPNVRPLAIHMPKMLLSNLLHSLKCQVMAYQAACLCQNPTAGPALGK
jgi:hypothetical protein